MTFGTMWDDAPTEREAFKKITTGDYNATITDYSVDVTKDPGRVQFTFEVTGSDDEDLDAEFSGRKAWGNYQLNEKGIPFLKQDMFTLGLPVDDVHSLDELANVLGNSINKHVKVHIKSAPGKTGSKIFTNVYINGLDTDDAEEESGPGFDKNEDIPF